MPLPSIDVFEGAEVRELVDSLEKMRKELQYVLANLDTSNVNGFDASVINAGVINGEHLHIDSTVSFADEYDPEGLRTEMNTQFDVVDGLIQGKVSTQTFNLLGGRVASTESSISVMVGEIALKASSTTVTALQTRVNNAEISISGLNSTINLKADSTVVTALGTRVNTAEININGLNSTITSKVSYTDYNGTQIVSMINQTPYYIEINASKINLVGAVSVLSDISGNLGRITTGDIDIQQSAYIGAGLYLRGPGNYTGVYFGSTQINQDSSGWLSINSGISSRGSFTEFYGSVDFSRANVSGLGGSSSTAVRYSSTSRRLYVDFNGSQQGWINLDG